MKNLTLIIAIVLGMTIGASAQNGGLFGKGPDRQGESYDSRSDGPMISLPTTHGDTNDQGAPLGGGALLLIGFGAAYALRKKKK